MPYESPGTSTDQKFERTSTAPPQNKQMPTMLMGPAYQVVEQADVGANFDPRESADQSFSWPDLKTGAVVDLAGTRNGRIDSQRKEYLTDPRRAQEALVPEVYLKDGAETTRVDDEHLLAIDQDGFDVAASAKDGTRRAQINAYILTYNQSTIFYNPDGGFGPLEDGDLFSEGGQDFSVASHTNKRLETEQDASAAAQSFDKYETVGDSDKVTINPATTSGRVDITKSSGTFGSVAAGSAVVIGQEMAGLTSVEGAYNDGNSSATNTEIDGLTFGTSLTTGDIQDYVVRLVDKSTGDVAWGKVVSIDTGAGTIDTDIDNTTLPDNTDDNAYEVTVYDGQIGYVESINAADDSLVAVVPETVSQSKTFAYFINSKQSIDVYPDFDVLASFRAARQDLADQPVEIAGLEDITTKLDQEGFDYRDGLGWAARVHWETQDGQAPFYVVPVDPEPNSQTGLPANEELNTGYSNALAASESITDGYQVATLHYNATINSAIDSHVAAMENNDQNRRGYQVVSVPKGQYDQTTGKLRPGYVPGGIADSDTDGNKVIKDPNLDFLTEAGVVEGTDVVVTFPDKYAGTYQALGTTTDNDLILKGDNWAIDREFQPGDGAQDHQMEVTDSDGDGTWEFREHSSGPSIPEDHFTHVEPGDYAEADMDFGNGTKTYRFRIVDVPPNGKGFDAVDEVSGDLSLPSSPETAKEVAIIRSWSKDNAPALRYHIKPLSAAAQKDALLDQKGVTDRRISLMINQRPTMQVGTDSVGAPIKKKLPPTVTTASTAAYRSSMEAYEDVSMQYLGGGIEEVEYADGHFRPSHIEELAGGGYLIINQKSDESQPYIHDMRTSDHANGLARAEEVVTSNADWQERRLNATFGPTPGTVPPNITDQLLGIRTGEINNILGTWVEEGRLVDFTLRSVTKVSARKTGIEYDAVLPVGEKNVQITMYVEV